MTQLAFDPTARACPDCGRVLREEGTALRCAEHGGFFSYGPQLVVRCATTQAEPQAALHPWETLGERARA